MDLRLPKVTITFTNALLLIVALLLAGHLVFEIFRPMPGRYFLDTHQTEWVLVFDTATGKRYYFDRMTRSSLWVRS